MTHTRSWWSNPRLWMLAIVLFAAVSRLVHMDWDQNHHFHPDERAVISAVQRLTFRPLQWNPQWFNYGSLPIYLTKLTSTASALIEPQAASYDGIILQGRYLSAVIGALTVWVLILLGTRLYDRSVGLLAGLLLAACALHIQYSRFLAVDVPLTFVVLLALYAMVSVSREGRTLSYILAGLCIGFATATKFSALPLFVPLGVAALHRCFVERRPISVAGRCVLAVLAAVAAFAIGEPYGLIDFKTFYRDVFEQSFMVRNAGAYPYTTQYMHTPKYVYDVTQMVVWGMAPLLGVVAVWATVTRPAVAWRRRSGAEWVLLAWVIPFFLITGWFEVKFPRYLLPIYPLMILWAAEWLVRKYRSGSFFGRVAAPLVVAGTLAAAFAFMATYARPITVLTASEWVYRHVPPGSKILSQSWDEGFPFSLPGHGPNTFHIEEFGYYDQPDNAAKMQKLSQALASSDYIAFQTKRLYGAVTRAAECDPQHPDKRCYPLTSKYFYELFSGDLGYTLIQEVASRPSLFGIEIPDELGDESLTVYDHPKVLIFQNTGRFDAAKIFDTIIKGSPSKSLTRNDLLLARPGNDASVEPTITAPPIRSSALALLLFAMLVELLSLSTFPLLRRWLTGFGTLALSKTLGVLLFAYVSWLLVSLDVASFTQGTLTAIVAIFALFGAVAWQRGERVPLTRGEIIATEALFWGTFAFFLVVRMYNPEVYWGEKPMDFSFLNALTRATTMPPPEPWFSGSPLQYSYFGYYTVAALGKTLHLDPALTFNLGIALMAGLTAAAAFAVGAAITNRWQTGALAAFFVAVIGNLAGPRELMGPHKIVNFDYFWATSRVVRDTINEFPLWSFLFADLHAHVMVMPISLTFLCLTVMWLRLRVIHPHQPRPSGTTLALLALLCLALGGIVVTNAWSLPTYVLLFPFLVGSLWLTEGDHRGVLRFLWGGITRVLLPTAAVLAGAYTLFLPFFLHFTPPERNWGWERGTLVVPKDFLTIWGIFLFALVPFLYALWTRDLPPRDSTARGSWTRGSRTRRSRTRGPRTRRLRTRRPRTRGPRTCGAPIRGPAARCRPRRAVVVGDWSAAGQPVRLDAELCADSVPPGALCAAGAADADALAYSGGPGVIRLCGHRRVRHGVRVGPHEHALQVLLGSLVPAGDLGGGGGGGAMDWRAAAVVAAPAVAGADGRAHRGWPVHRRHRYLRCHQDEPRADREADPRRHGVPAQPSPGRAGRLRVAESQHSGDSGHARSAGALVSGVHAGRDEHRPAHRAGMEDHVFQRAHPWPEINRRKADIQLAYTSADKDTVAAILQRYHVKLVFVGALERRTYAGGNLANFTEWKDLLTPVYQNQGVTVFGVNGAFAETMPVTTIEEVPPVGGAEAEAPLAPDAPGVLHQPRGIAITATGDIVVCDFSNNRIQEFDHALKFIRTWGKGGELPGQFKEPCGVAVAPSGDIVVADTWNQRIQIFDKEGKYLREFSAGFYGQRGVTVDAKGTIFVADTGNARVLRFSASGQKEAEWGGKGDEPGKFKEPVGIATDAAGQVYVCDNGNGRVQIFTRDGQFVSAFSVPGWESVVYSEPYITIDPTEKIWVTVPVAKEVRAYDKSGKLLRTIKSQSVPGVTFETPMGIAYAGGAQPELVIADLENRLVRIPYAQ